MLKFCLLLLLLPAISFTVIPSEPNEVAKCYLNFLRTGELSMSNPQRINQKANEMGMFGDPAAGSGISVRDGYRMVYYNKGKVPIVTLTIYISEHDLYGKDTTLILSDLKDLMAHGSANDSSELIILRYNGFTVYGTDGSPIRSGKTPAKFVMFPEDGLSVCFEFNETTSFDSNSAGLDDYKSRRNAFIADYTSHLNDCKKR